MTLCKYSSALFSAVTMGAQLNGTMVILTMAAVVTTVGVIFPVRLVKRRLGQRRNLPRPVQVADVSSSTSTTYRIYEQPRFRQACASAQSRQSLRCLRTWSIGAGEGFDKTLEIYALWMTAHARLKNEFTEGDKCHNLKSWLIIMLFIALGWHNMAKNEHIYFYLGQSFTAQSHACC